MAKPTAEQKAILDNLVLVRADVDELVQRSRAYEARARAPDDPADQVGRMIKQRQISRIPFHELSIKGEIGRGGCGVVYLASTPRCNYFVAVKRLYLSRLSADSAKEFLNECTVMKRLSAFKEVLTLVGVCIEPDLYCIITKFATRGSLFSILYGSEGPAAFDQNDRSRAPPNTWKQTIHWAHDVAVALVALHAENIFHRDLKSANVLIGEDDQAMVSDFGFAKIRSDSIVSTQQFKAMGTAHWMAPELLSEESPVYSASTDMYAFGVILYELVANRIPFFSSPPPAFLLKVCSGQRAVIPAWVPQWLSSLIGDLWAQDPTRRPPSRVVESLLKSHLNDADPRVPMTPPPATPLSESKAPSSNSAAVSPSSASSRSISASPVSAVAPISPLPTPPSPAFSPPVSPSPRQEPRPSGVFAWLSNMFTKRQPAETKVPIASRAPPPPEAKPSTPSATFVLSPVQAFFSPDQASEFMEISKNGTSDQIAELRRALDSNPDLAVRRFRDPPHMTLAMQVAAAGSTEIMAELIKYPVNLTVTDELGRTAAHVAASHGQVNVLRQLASVNEALLDAPDYAGESPIFYAAKAGGLEAVKYLVGESLSRLKQQNKAGHDVLLAAKEFSESVSTRKRRSISLCIEFLQLMQLDIFHYAAVGDSPTVEKLLSTCPQLAHARNAAWLKWTPLMYAARAGSVPCTKALMAQGIDVNATDFDGRTAAHVAAAANHTNVLSQLATNPQTKFDIADHAGQTPLFDAAKRGSISALTFLVQRDVDVNHLDSSGWNVVQVASAVADAKNQNCIDYLNSLPKFRRALDT